jgi:hypothetical protein
MITSRPIIRGLFPLYLIAIFLSLAAGASPSLDLIFELVRKPQAIFSWSRNECKAFQAAF